MALNIQNVTLTKLQSFKALTPCDKETGRHSVCIGRVVVLEWLRCLFGCRLWLSRSTLAKTALRRSVRRQFQLLHDSMSRSGLTTDQLHQAYLYSYVRRSLCQIATYIFWGSFIPSPPLPSSVCPSCFSLPPFPFISSVSKNPAKGWENALSFPPVPGRAWGRAPAEIEFCAL